MGLDMEGITHHIDIVVIHYPLSLGIILSYAPMHLIDIFSHGNYGQKNEIINFAD